MEGKHMPCDSEILRGTRKNTGCDSAQREAESEFKRRSYLTIKKRARDERLTGKTSQ